MAKFCTNCGKPLNESEECSCKREVKIEHSQIANGYLEQLLGLMKKIFTKPVDTLKEFTKKEDVMLASCLIGATSIFIGLFIMLFIHNFVGTVVGSLNLGFASVVNGFPYFRYFATFTIIALSTLFLLAFLLYLLADKVFGGKTTWKKMIGLVGVTSIIILLTVITGSIIMYLSYKLLLLVLIAGGLYAFVIFFQGLKLAVEINDNKLGYLFVSASLLTVIFTCYIIPTIIL